MVELSLPRGPWKKTVNAQWHDFPVSLYESPSGEVLMVVFEKDEEKTTGLISVVNKIYSVIGDTSKLESTDSEHELTIFTKVSKQGTHKFLLCYSDPKYSSFAPVDFKRSIESQLIELDAVSNDVHTLESKYGFKLIDLKEESDDVKQVLLSDPLLIFALFNPLSVKQQTGNLAVPLGKSSDGEIIKVKLDDLTATTVIGGSRDDRLAVIQVVAENALQNNIPVIVFDSINAFDGLAKPNTNQKEIVQYKDFGLMATPAGYPYKKFKLGQDVYIDLLKVEPKEFTSVFGFQESDSAAFIVKTFDEKKLSISTLSDLARELENASNTAATQYIKYKALRLTRVLNKTYKQLFSKTTPVEIALPWRDGIGKVVHIDVTGQDKQIVDLFVKTIIELVPQPPASNLSVLFAFSDEGTSTINAALVVNSKFSRKAAFAIQGANESAVKQIKDATLVVKLSAGSVFVSTPSVPEKRIDLRPTYSQKNQTTVSMPLPKPAVTSVDMPKKS